MRRLRIAPWPLLALALLLSPVRAEDGEDEDGPDGPAAEAAADLAKRTDAAIEKGVAYMRGEQKRGGSWSTEEGPTALALLALHRSGVREGDRGYDAGLRWLMARRHRLDTYGLALTVLVLVKTDAVKYRKSIRRLALQLVMGQCRNGQWTYKCRPGRPKRRGDNSNTQFAVLALWAARGAGVPVAPHVFTRVREHWLETQNADGGWGYSANQRKDSYGSMTAAGTASTAITTAALAEPGTPLRAIRADRAVKRGLEWLGREFVVDANPKVDRDLGGRLRERRGKRIGDSFWRLYYLWSLERVGRLSGVDRFGEHDWYAEGAEALLAEQRDDGRWVGGVSPEIGTCFALLFLTRGTRPISTEPITGTATTPPEHD